ncbi:hypothetical protein Q3V23_07125 [Streptomyces sp. VNUA116]|uniref:hypothetical protein n=1 Tax=Streptomyces sp. VNUA116 TaxID=3062449 RepID=UPI002675D6B2|nr:hypothetical protein [Streptomyces sp. VNUA116]WKU43876.1 hypothetical protein Q3V23_07125 [Streptomyces sp. VNUA116]
MFDVSNKTAHDGMMVYGASRNQDDCPPAQQSIWMDVGSLPGEDKWNPEEGRALEQCLGLLRECVTEVRRRKRLDSSAVPLPQDTASSDFSEVMTRRLNESMLVVSPFQDVVSDIGRMAGNRLSSKRYGTVHTTRQGGGHRRPGPRHWCQPGRIP